MIRPPTLQTWIRRIPAVPDGGSFDAVVGFALAALGFLTDGVDHFGFARVMTQPTSMKLAMLVDTTHVAQALGHLAVRQGAHARFAKTSRILAELARGHADGTWDKRMRELIRPDVLILDDFAMRRLTAAQADDLYESVSERQGRSLITTSNRAPSDWYPSSPTPSSPSRFWTG